MPLVNPTVQLTLVSDASISELMCKLKKRVAEQKPKDPTSSPILFQGQVFSDRFSILVPNSLLKIEGKFNELSTSKTRVILNYQFTQTWVFYAFVVVVGFFSWAVYNALMLKTMNSLLHVEVSLLPLLFTIIPAIWSRYQLKKILTTKS